MKSRIIQLCLLAWSVFLVSCSENDDPIDPDENPLLEILLNKSEISMGVSDLDTLSVTTDIGVLMADYESSNSAVVTIDDQGILEALSPGSAEITVTVDDLVAKCQVTVKLKTLELNHAEIILKVTDKDTLLVTSELFDRSVVWASSDASIVSVDEEGRLMALKSGTAEISATADELTTSCKVTVELTIFLGGSYKEYEAAYWKDGELFPLTNDGEEVGLYSKVNSIKVVNGDIFAGGQKQERLTTVWKNGEEINIEIGGANEIQELAVVEGEIIGVGGNGRVFLWDESAGYYYWTESGVTNRAASIFVENSDIYVAGMSNNGSINRATVWKNEQAFTLDYTTSHIVKDVFVMNGDFYTCAYEFIETSKYKLKYWKNETLVEVTDGSSRALPSAILVVGEDVYISGSLNNRPVIWKNDEVIYYAESGVIGSINELITHGDDIYAVGNITVSEFNQAGLVWKNGEEIFRTDLFDNAYLNSIEIK